MKSMYYAGLLCENPNKTLEGIKTCQRQIKRDAPRTVKTLIKPWKGLKLYTGPESRFLRA
ncbi:hypothetical protein U27_01422 [Candidatus Vecturithrix granuli]|uniref:Uncharacterized protein n=1 Tax=Vecturithrix granuli TaxID=1499967 RepID=A0A081CAB6_VECG1|nr:hypothetical protein U27_01422 [Candidatus Vecturithrix granuli]